VDQSIRDFVYGKNQTERVVSVEIDDSVATLYLDKGITQARNEFFCIHSDQTEDDMITLNGDLHYKFVKKFDNSKDFRKHVAMSKAREEDVYAIYNPKEAFMVKTGVTYYKGMKPSDLRVLSFDIETTGLDPKSCQVLMISTALRDESGSLSKILFSIDDYNSEKEMIYAFCNYVVANNPHVMVGHNILAFDLPFLKQRAGSLPLGVDKQAAQFATRPSLCRKDASQKYDYFNVLVRGREIVDTFHLAIKYDVAGNYRTYKLKDIVRQEGLERDDRSFVDASKMKKYFDERTSNPDQWQKVKDYAIHDVEDALKLFELMIPAYFYFCQSVPKTLQQIVSSGRSTGNQINSFLVRSYLSDKHSLPKASEVEHYEGATSFGNPGVYEYVGKVDVASLYPSIIREYKIYDKNKDPKGYFLRMVEFFTLERLNNKRLGKETGERYYKDLEQAQKIVINSAYGFMGAPGLNFNSPRCAADVTHRGRDILHKGLEWAESKGWRIVNADTDSFSFITGNRFPPGAFKEWIKELNTLYPEKIRWEDDGMYRSVIVIKTKNYIMKEALTGKVKIIGGALKATSKERALQKMIDEVIAMMLDGRKEDVLAFYESMVRECFKITKENIQDWVSKKTITKKLVISKRANETRVVDAYKRAKLSVQEGDKIFVYFSTDKMLSVIESFDGVYDVRKLIGKVYNTIKVFKTVLDMAQFKKYHNKREFEKLSKELQCASSSSDTRNRSTSSATSLQSASSASVSPTA
jgi:DNA polymerase elongation subunit (family B)